jgi:hypothetical protein
MSIRTSLLHRGLVRAGAVSLATLASVALWAPAAGAASTVTIPLDPDQIWRHAMPLNGATAAPTSFPVTWPSGSNAVQYSGSITVTVPPEYTPGTPVAELHFYPAGGGGFVRSYSSASAVPADQLTLTDLGSNQYRVDLPVDDGTHACCQMGSFALYGFTSSVPGDAGLTYMNSLGHTLDFSGGGPASVPLESWLWVDSGKCADYTSGSCAITTVTEGTQLQITLPASSSLTAYGIADLSSSTFYQVESDRYGTLTWAHSRVLTAAISADGRNATLTIPAGDFPDLYAIQVVPRPSSRLVATASLLVQEMPAANAGLRSNTGWGESEGPSGSGSAPLVVLGGGMMLVAGVTAAVAVRRRRVATAE